jgi:hypothetical protein
MIGLLGVFFSFFWIDYWSYEAAVCLARQQPAQICKKDLEQKIKLGSFFTSSQILQMYANSRQAVVHVKSQAHLELNFIHKNFKHNLNLPLVPR